jgi:ribosome recycling factor
MGANGEAIMTDQEVLDDLKKEMEKTVTAFRRELARTRTGRASTALLEGIHADYYGAKTPLIQLATLSAPEPRLLVVQPFDKTALTAIEKAIQQSDLGLNPMNDGKILRIPIPELTAERRKEIVRHLHKVAEDFRVSVRAHRHDALELLKEMLKEKELTEDDNRHARDKIEAATKDYLERVDKVLKSKEEEVLSV